MYSSVKQIKDYVFCGDCEQCFGKAEAWIKPMLPAIGGPFPFREHMTSQQPRDKAENWTLYTTATNPQLDTAKLMHFAVGVFYKGAVHHWNNGKTESYIKVPPKYQEGLRRYLLGLGKLPKNIALLVTVDSSSTVWQAMIQPYPAEPLQGFERYVFYIPGLFFQLLLGDGVHNAFPLSFSESSDYAVLLEDVSHPMRNTAREQTANAKRPLSLEKLVAELEAKGLSIRIGE